MGVSKPQAPRPRSAGNQVGIPELHRQCLAKQNSTKQDLGKLKLIFARGFFLGRPLFEPPPTADESSAINKETDHKIRRQLVVRAIAGKDKITSDAQRGPASFQGQIVSAIQRSQHHNSQEAGHLEVEAVLGSSLANMTRYQSALKRDLYRAIEMLRTVQAERREREGGDS